MGAVRKLFRDSEDEELSMSEQVSRQAVSSKGSGKRGYINPRIVKGFSFFVITVCIVISVVATILAIWKFAETDVLWRTVATCFVVAAGAAIFAFANAVFGDKG